MHEKLRVSKADSTGVIASSLRWAGVNLGRLSAEEKEWVFELAEELGDRRTAALEKQK